MSDIFVERAMEIAGRQVSHLRALIAEIEARLGPAQSDLRQLARTLDEMTIRVTAVGRSGPVGRQVEQLQRRHTALSEEIASLQRAQRAIDQLVRQIEMSSAALRGDGPAADDPWRAALMAQVIQGREEERVRLAREIHDGTAQVIAHVVMGLEYALSLAQQPDRERLRAHLAELRDTSRSGLHEVRRFIADLRPPALERQGLSGALRELGERFASAGLLRVQYDGTSLPRLSPEQEIVIYRIAQEALNNAAKHAPRTNVQLTCGVYAEQLLLGVRDDGPGFDPRTAAVRAKGKHWGMRSMSERAELIGARLQVSSVVGKGTTISLTLPLSG